MTHSYVIDRLPISLTANEYQQQCLATAGGDEGSRVVYTALGLAGEAGEVADLIKKHVYHGHPLDKDKILKELGDVVWYASMAAHTHGFTLEEVMEANLKKLKERYPNGFTREDSINRLV